MLKKKLLLVISFVLIIVLAFLSYFFYEKARDFELEIQSIDEKCRAFKNKYLSLMKEKKLLERCYSIEKEVSTLRGLHLKYPINYKVIDKIKLNEILNKRFNEVYEGDSFYNMEKALKIIGMIKDDVDLKSVLMKLYKEQAAAFYDYDNKIMYLVNNAFFTKRIENMFISHELTHAIQDQHYGLVEMGIDRKDNNDAVIALEALLEGDATFVMEKFYKQNLGLGVFIDVVSGVILELKQKEIDYAPPYLSENMLFPYIKGLNFVKNIYENKYLNIENVFLDPPSTTEQILHTEKYFINRDEPDYPKLPDLSEFYSKYNLVPLYENIFGELNINILLKLRLPYKLSNESAQGWDGDRYVVFKNIDDDSLYGYIFITRWDTYDDAREFFEAFYQWAKLRYGITEDHYIDESYLVTIKTENGLSCSINLKEKDCVIFCSHSDIFSDLNDILTYSEDK